MNNLIEENIQKYQLNQDDKIYVFSTGLVGNNLRLSCYEYHENTPQEIAYSSIFTIEQLKRENQIFQIAKDCEDVQSIFEDVILAQSVGILEGEGYLDVYFYMALNGKRAKIILRLMWIKKTPPPPSRQLNEFQINQERLTRLQYNANQLLNEQNALRKQLNSFFEENAIEINQGSHNRSRSTNQNNYRNQLNEYNITNNVNMNNIQNNNKAVNNMARIQVSDDDNEVYEVPVNDVAP